MGSRVPNAWDDDFDAAAADVRALPSTPSPPTDPSPQQQQQQQKKQPTRAERRTQHAEANKALWNSAESAAPQTPFFVAARDDAVPLAAFRPAVTVLSRKPAAPPAAGRNAADDDDDSEEEARREQEAAFKARQERARVDRELKQRKYDEVRSRLFGTPEAEKPAATAGATTAGRARGGGRRGRGGGSHNSGSGSAQPSRGSSADRSPRRQLYEPEYAAKPGSVYLAGRGREGGRQTAQETAHIRQPRGPDGSGRGGFGFAARGGKAGTA